MAKSKQKTLVSFLLDRTGSMASIKADTIGGFNAYVGTLQKDGKGLIDFTFLQFDSVSIDKVHVGVPVKDVALLTDETYQPRAWTPLIDAAYKTIKATEEALTKRDDKPKVVVAIQTDGDENASTEHTWDELNALIKEKTAAGWEFVFMGAGLDAYKQARRMGIATANTMSYDMAKSGSAFRSLASNNVLYAAGASATMAYDSAQKMDAGDVFDPSASAGAWKIDPLMGPAQGAGPAPAKPRKKVVDDFTL